MCNVILEMSSFERVFLRSLFYLIPGMCKHILVQNSCYLPLYNTSWWLLQNLLVCCLNFSMVVISERFLLANLLYFSFTYFSNSLTIQVNFHEVPEYIILYSRIELLQPESLTENKKNITLQNYKIKTIFFQRHNNIFDWRKIGDSIWMWDKNNLT